ncbi:FkbM family methyltransferase [Thalassovita aquimarina]|uniref:FkbM family methyltransferase n=1 Tax=Thalassovita aquimarina TaxID=2785917 RepID=A0ABS5HMB8_9RHOB|nr:FkbM family methyltransferase [Thalassovita aquimarina]MBR9650063.1 FkbM family methyltransferase [Thalassovita aquimarina]
MTEGWEKWITDLGAEPLGTLLHLGAGRGRLLETTCAADAERIVLVEPYQDDAAALVRRTAGDERVTVMPVAIGAKTGRANLHRFNMAALSSLRAPGALRELFPGLRETALVEVETLTAADLMKQLPAPDNRSDVLLLDTPGEEAEILKGLIAIDGLVRFRDIFLRTGRNALYEGGTGLPDLIALLRKEGFTPRRRCDTDPDFPELHFRIEPVVQNNRALCAELAETRGQLVAREARIAELETALDNALAEAKTKQTEMQDRFIALRSSEEKAKQDLSLALRLQSMRDADISALEKKYAEVLQQKESQDQLLRKLTARLSSAAKYLQQQELGEIRADDPQLEEKTAEPGEGNGRSRKAGGRK